jgi:co-chaperonin GroES (HSP10)
MPALLAVHDVDPRKEIMKKVRPSLVDMTLYGNAILVATYKRPKMAKFKSMTLAMPDSDEDKYQGKVGLVLKLGPMAYKDDDAVQFHGQDVKVGDWVVYRPSDGWALTLVENQVDCRMLVEASIRMKISSPDAVW